MKIIYIVIASLLLSSSVVFSQNVSNIAFINDIADKKQASFADGAGFFVIIIGANPKSFKENINMLNSKGITTGISKIENTPLTRGTFALMIARYLNLKDSLMFRIFKTERYAYRACIAKKIMSADGSELEKISGGELIEIMTKVSEAAGGKE